MSHATKSQYDLLIEIRPWKFDREQVNYRESTGEEMCGTCPHLYKRSADSFAVCEIFRDDETDEKGIDSKYVCDFWNDGEDFPLLDDETR